MDQEQRDHCTTTLVNLFCTSLKLFVSSYPSRHLIVPDTLRHKDVMCHVPVVSERSNKNSVDEFVISLCPVSVYSSFNE